MSPTTPRSPSRHQPTSPPSNYMQAVQSLDARPLAELHNEYSYLVHDLQKQGDRATRLFHRYAAVDARLAEAQTASEAKRCKREASLIKTKIAESTQQEKLILLRLGQMHVELQTRNRWMTVHHQQPVLHLPPLVYPPPPPAAPPAPTLSQGQDQAPCNRLSSCQEQKGSRNNSTTEWPSDSNSCGSPPLQPPSFVLSPLSPCFTPGAVVFSEDIWSRASKTSSAGKQMPIESVDGEAEEQQRDEEIRASHQLPGPATARTAGATHGEKQPQKAEEDTNPGFPEKDIHEDQEQEPEPEQEEDDEEPWMTELRRVSLYSPLSSSLRARNSDKRMSLPYFKSLWPPSSRSRRGSFQSTAGLRETVLTYLG
ncbi:hypothetical protein N657DRAFT_635738 [Parathielavia appendiculata]|uniref:Uncharacterized protein n=1 Tax=Parathielavia appendiculata TaxID=2587402 RepID=A0AAN6TWC9_9PEZI|nr:hypothetical protein N657DRAFT_635738 [Parathielavia appendiculata]